MCKWTSIPPFIAVSISLKDTSFREYPAFLPRHQRRALPHGDVLRLLIVALSQKP
jgi:hypothetical protein